LRNRYRHLCPVTAADAHMREYHFWVLNDAAAAAENDERGRWALEIMARSMAADTTATSQKHLDEWLANLPK